MNERFQWKIVVCLLAGRFERAYGWDAERAVQVAETAADQMRKDFGGSRHYLPTGNGMFRDSIRKEFDGRNIAILARKYGVSCRTVMRYVVEK